MTRTQKEATKLAMVENLMILGWSIDRWQHYKLTRDSQKVEITMRIVFNPNRIRVERLINSNKTWSLIQSFSYDEYIQANDLVLKISGVR